MKNSGTCRPVGCRFCILSTLGFVFSAALSPAGALSGIHHAEWCNFDPYKPFVEAAREVATPDGKRGQRTGHQLMRAARAAARSGRDDDAIAFVLVCQWHNESARKDVKRDRDAVLKYLKELEMM